MLRPLLVLAVPIFLILFPFLAAAEMPGPFIAASFSARAPSLAGWTLDGPPRSFPPETMYEHVDGEAELFKRYGARALFTAAYQGPGDASLAVDVLDCGREENAFGLFRLYTGCEESAKERPMLGGRMMGDKMAFAVFGPLFLKVNGVGGGVSVAQVEAFLRALARPLPVLAPLPPAVATLESFAAAPCEVTYVPDHLDFNFSSGPGWKFKDRKGRECFIAGTSSVKEATALGDRAQARGVGTLVSNGRGVAWSPAAGAEADLARYLKTLVDRRGCLWKEGGL